MTFVDKLQDTIDSMELSILGEEINLEWMRTKRAQLTLAGDKPSKDKQDLIDRLNHDIPIQEEKIKGLRFSNDRYSDRLKKENGHGDIPTKKSS